MYNNETIAVGLTIGKNFFNGLDLIKQLKNIPIIDEIIII